MVITTPQGRKKCKGAAITLNGSPLQIVQSAKYLGVIVDHHLSWAEHIDKVRKSVNTGIALINRIKDGISKGDLVSVYHGFIGSHLDYCCPVW